MAMILQSITPRLHSNSDQKNNRQACFSNAVSSASGLLRNSTLFLKQSTRCKSHKNPTFVTCSSLSQVHNYGTVGYEEKPTLKWNVIYEKISTLEDPSEGAASVLNQVENQGKSISKKDLCRVVKELRKFGRSEYALEVHRWMINRAEIYRITPSDISIKLDLIAEVHGIHNAEKYFLKLPDGLKDKKIYSSLLNAYVWAEKTKKAESLMDEMRNRGYADDVIPFNVMMTLYMDRRDYKKIESLILEMKEKNIQLNAYTYDIWLSSRGAEGDLKKMEEVFEQMQLDHTINPYWTTYSTMATMYIKLGHFEKGEDCLRKLESRISNRDQKPYHYLISLYGIAGNKEEVHRVWNVYKASFVNIPSVGYHTVISTLVILDDIDGAEKIYDEWLSVKSPPDLEVGNLLLSTYVRKGLSEKAETFFDQMIELGGNPNSMTWDILAENHIQNMRIPEAISCIQNGISAIGSRTWKPRPSNVISILEICHQKGDKTNKDNLLDVLRQSGSVDALNFVEYITKPRDESHEAPTSSVPTVEDLADIDWDHDGSDLPDGSDLLLNLFENF